MPTPFLSRRGYCWLLVGLVPALSACCDVSQAAEPRSWYLKREFSAPEAKQAVAASDQHIFVVTNELVMKYKRVTQRPIARSIGPAKHLNSAFVWDDQVYLAHSNFPETPEKSQIMLLNVASMKLTKFHDFGNFGGSLTWCVRDDDHWWCNFAIYGDENHKTFLVRFDMAWKETGRWTYPKPVIGRIGKMSFSGGIWYQGELLVSDHDNKRLYRFQLPDAGDELVFLGEDTAPLTGQGFAFDPKTGGLVGIDRARKQVLFMEAAP